MLLQAVIALMVMCASPPQMDAVEVRCRWVEYDVSANPESVQAFEDRYETSRSTGLSQKIFELQVEYLREVQKAAVVKTTYEASSILTVGSQSTMRVKSANSDVQFMISVSSVKDTEVAVRIIPSISEVSDDARRSSKTSLDFVSDKSKKTTAAFYLGSSLTKKGGDSQMIEARVRFLEAEVAPVASK